MAYYTILNFEDALAGASPNSIKGSSKSDEWKSMGAGAAAEGTARVYERRAARDSKMFDRKKVVYYPCQELISRDKAGNLSRQDVNVIREDCRKSKTIAFVVHGKPSDTDTGFSTTGGSVCSWQELANLAKLLLPLGDRTYHIALIMCYGARSSDATLNHEGQLSEGAVKSSFAYKFFSKLCQSRDVRMSAFTGAVSNDADMSHTVEREGEVLIAMEKQAIKTKRTIMNASGKTAKELKDAEKDELIKSGRISADEFSRLVAKFAQQPDLAPGSDLETFAKEYVIYSNQAFGYAKNLHASKGTGNKSKYGKFIYTYSGGVFTVEARYATNSHSANHVLYTGALT